MIGDNVIYIKYMRSTKPTGVKGLQRKKTTVAKKGKE